MLQGGSSSGVSQGRLLAALWRRVLTVLYVPFVGLPWE